jgi:hypothetical protein
MNQTQAHCVRFTFGHARHLYLSKSIRSGYLEIATFKMAIFLVLLYQLCIFIHL